MVCIATVVLYNSQVADPQWGTFAFPFPLSFLFPLSLEYLEFLSPVSTPWLLLILYRAFYSYICILTSPFISKSIIISSFSPVLFRRLCTLYKLTIYIVFAVLNLILDCPGLKLAVAVYRGLLIRQPLLYIPYVLYIPI